MGKKQELLLQKSNRVKGVVELIGNKLELYNSNNVPSDFQEKYDKISYNAVTLDYIISRARKEEALDICEKLLNDIVHEVNEFNFVLALYNKSCTE